MNESVYQNIKYSGQSISRLKTRNKTEMLSYFVIPFIVVDKETYVKATNEKPNSFCKKLPKHQIKTHIKKLRVLPTLVRGKSKKYL